MLGIVGLLLNVVLNLPLRSRQQACRMQCTLVVLKFFVMVFDSTVFNYTVLLSTVWIWPLCTLARSLNWRALLPTLVQSLDQFLLTP